jgi:hypothetical protein
MSTASAGAVQASTPGASAPASAPDSMLPGSSKTPELGALAALIPPFESNRNIDFSSSADNGAEVLEEITTETATGCAEACIENILCSAALWHGANSKWTGKNNCILKSATLQDCQPLSTQHTPGVYLLTKQSCAPSQSLYPVFIRLLHGRHLGEAIGSLGGWFQDLAIALCSMPEEIESGQTTEDAWQIDSIDIGHVYRPMDYLEIHTSRIEARSNVVLTALHLGNTKLWRPLKID